MMSKRVTFETALVRYFKREKMRICVLYMLQRICPADKSVEAVPLQK